MAFVSRAVISFIQVPLTVAYLGNDRLGLWRVAVSITTILTLIRTGIVPSLKTGLASACARNDRHSMQLYGSASSLLALACAAASVLAAVVAWFIQWDHVLSIEDRLSQAEAPWVFSILALYSMLVFGIQVMEAILDAKLILAVPRVLDFLGPIVGFGAMLWGMHRGWGLPGIVAASVLPGLALRFLEIELIRRADPSLLKPWVAGVGKLLVGMFRPGTVAMAIQFASVGLSALPSILIARWLSLRDVTNFGVASQLVSYPLAALSAIMPVVWPAVTYAWEHKRYDHLARRFRHMILLTTLGLALFAAGATLLGPRFVDWWTRGRVIVNWPLLLILAFGGVAQGLGYWTTTFLWATAQLRSLLMAYVAGVVTFTLTCYILTRPFGLHGMAIATGIGAFALFAVSARRMKQMIRRTGPLADAAVSNATGE